MDEQDGAARYHSLETIRQYAREKLFESGEAAALRDRHLDFFVQLAAQFEPQLFEPNMLEWLDRLEADYDNLRAAVEWGLEHDPEAALRLAGPLQGFWISHGYYEARGWLEAGLAQLQALPPVEGARAIARNRAVSGAWLAVGLLAFVMGETPVGIQALNKALVAPDAEDKRNWCLAETFRAIMSAFVADVPLAQASAERGLALAQEIHVRAPATTNRAMLAWAAGQRGDRATQQAMLAELGPLSSQGNNRLMLVPWMFIGVDARWRGDLDLARSYLNEVVRLSRVLRVRHAENVGMSDLAHVDRQAGDFPAAVAGYRRAILSWKDLGHRAAVANVLECLAFIARAQYQLERSARLLGAAEALRETIGAAMNDYERAEYDAETAQLRAALDPAALTAAWAAGRAMTLDQAVALALGEMSD